MAASRSPTCPEMLEGQVAVLSAGHCSNASKESLAVLDALKASALFREDQYSYVLYPNKTLPRFLDKNNVDAAALQGPHRLCPADHARGRTATADIVTRDCHGGYHFNGSFNGVEAPRAAMSQRCLVVRTQHAGRPTRSRRGGHLRGHLQPQGLHRPTLGTFFGYEGLGLHLLAHGCSKLRLAAFEVTRRPPWPSQRVPPRWSAACSTTTSRSTQGIARIARPSSVRRLPHRPLFAHTRRQGRPAARQHDRRGQGGPA